MSKQPKLKYLKGSELVPYIQERQARAVRRLKQSEGLDPKLVIIDASGGNKAVATYIKYKRRYAREVGVRLEVLEVPQQEVELKLKALADDLTVHGIILQLPLQDPSQTDQVLSLIPREKDVDGLGQNPIVTPATAMAITWLLAGFGVEVTKLKVLVIGKGRLVGSPLLKLLEPQMDPLNLRSLDSSSSEEELEDSMAWADVVITATGSAGLLKLKSFKPGQVAIDAGTSESGGVITGDFSEDIYEGAADLGLKITPKIGGVGPLTIACLFENLITLINQIDRA